MQAKIAGVFGEGKQKFGNPGDFSTRVRPSRGVLTDVQNLLVCPHAFYVETHTALRRPSKTGRG